MDETIYAIPINDAFSDADGCPLCKLKADYESDLLRYYLGPALMEPSIRKQTNARGFCQKHFHSLHRSTINRLGLALILQTHLEEKQKSLTSQLKKLSQKPKKKSLFQSSESPSNPIISELLNEETCLYCEALQERMKQYYHSLVYLFQNDEKFKEKMISTKILCLPHAAELAVVAGEMLKPAEQSKFIGLLSNLIEDQINAVQTDLQWYVNKHDYRNQDEPWGTSREASLKAITLLLGEEIQ